MIGQTACREIFRSVKAGSHQPHRQCMSNKHDICDEKSFSQRWLTGVPVPAMINFSLESTGIKQLFAFDRFLRRTSIMRNYKIQGAINK